MPYDPSYHLLWNLARVRQLAREFQPDVLETHSTYLASLASWRLPRPPGQVRTLVWHSDHVGSYLEPAVHGRLGPAFGERLLQPAWRAIRALCGQFDAVVVGSRSQYERLRTHGVAHAELNPFGIDIKPWQQAARRARERAGHAPARAGLRVVACGRMAVEKRWDRILDAFALVAHGDPSWQLVALGDGPERPALERLAARRLPAGQYRFAGFVDDRERLAQELADADVLLHGCPSETFGLALAEALASGVCAVVPREGGAGEWVDGQRVRGYDTLVQAAAQLHALAAMPRAERLALPEPPVRSVHEHVAQQLALYERLRRAP